MRKLLILTIFLMSGKCFGQGNFFMWHGTAPFTVSTNSITAVSYDRFTVNCEIINCASITVTSRGVVFATHTTPTTSDMAWANGNGCGTYSVSPYNLVFQPILPSTTYYVRSYAIVGGGPVYGNELTVTTTSPDIGDSYGEGIVAYIFQSGDVGFVSGECHGLIAATSDQSAGIRWYNGTFIDVNTTLLEIGSGFDNTNEIISTQGAVVTSYAAGLARSYSGGGYTDWFLPSRGEMLKVIENKDLIGGFVYDDYWTSTEHFYDDYAYVAGGDYDGVGKNLLRRVRAIRYF